MKKIFGDIIHSKYKGELIAALLLSVLTMCFLCYEDAICLAVWSTNIWDSIFEGRFFEYYQFCMQNTHDLPLLCPGGIILTKFPTAVWCLPIWIAQRFFGVEVKSSVLCMMWYRLFMVLLLLLVIVYVKKICRLLNYEESQISLISVLCATSVFVQISVSYAGQTDLMWILPGLMAFYSLLKGDWKKFYILVNISMLIKPYFFPIALLMILYYEKDVLKMIGRAFLCGIGYLVINTAFGFFPGYAEAKTVNSTLSMMLAGYLNNAVLFPYGWVSLLLVFVVLIAALAFFAGLKDENKDPQTIVCIAAMFYCAWFIFAEENFYRMVMLVPWLYIALFKEREKNEIMLWITTIYSYVVIFAYRFHETTFFFNVKRGMFASVIPQSLIQDTPDFFATINEKLGSTFHHMSYIMNGLWVPMTIIVVLLMFPKIYNKILAPYKMENREWVQRVLIWLNVLAIVLLDMSVLISFVV